MKTKNEDRDWVMVFQESIKTREKRPAGDGWKTREELQAIFGVGPDTAKKQLQSMAKNGLVESFKGTCISNSKIQNQTWYRIKKGKK